MSKKVQEFNEYRQKMNDKILASDNKVIKRIFNLDTNAFKEGHLPVKTKELLVFIYLFIYLFMYLFIYVFIDLLIICT